MSGIGGVMRKTTGLENRKLGKGENRQGKGKIGSGRERKKTYPQEFRIRKHTLLQARREEIHMIPHQLIHRSLDPPTATAAYTGPLTDTSATILIRRSLQSRHKRHPIWFHHLIGAEIQQLLHKTQHPVAQTPGSAFPALETRIRRLARPGGQF